MELTDFIYDFNLVTTKTAKDIYESCMIINSGREKEIDYANSVNLYELVRIFNDSYKEYLHDKDYLKKIISTLGKEFYYFEHLVDEDFSFITFEVIDPFTNIFDEKKAFVRFVNRDDNYYAKADNGKNCFHSKYKEKSLNLNKEEIKTVLEIVRRNNLFLESFHDLGYKFIFGNGTTTVTSQIEGDIFDKLTTFTLSFGNSYFNGTDFIKIEFSLGNNLEILYDKSSITIEDEDIEKVEDKKRLIDELLNGIYINNNDLNKLYRTEEASSKVYVKKGLEKWKN